MPAGKNNWNSWIGQENTGTSPIAIETALDHLVLAVDTRPRK